MFAIVAEGTCLGGEIVAHYRTGRGANEMDK